MQQKWMHWVAGLLLVLSLILPTWSAQAATPAGHARVKVRLVGLNGQVDERYVDVGAESFTNTSGQTIQMDGPTAMGALVDLLKSEGKSYEAKTSSYGSYVSKIGDLAEKQVNTNTGWNFWVNGKQPDVGADKATVQTGDEVVWAFWDYTKTLYPHLEISNQAPNVGDTVTVKATAEQTTYDANWNPTTQTVPVTDATIVTDDGTTYKTDSDGVAKITATHVGLNSFTLHKEDDKGLAWAVSTGKQYLLVGDAKAQFNDLNGYGWAQNAIQTLAVKGIAVGEAPNRFAPSQAVTRGELAKMAALCGELNIGGNATFSDLTADNLFYPYIETVAREGVMSGDAIGTFRAGDRVTREELASVAVRLAGLQTGGAMLTFQDAAQVDRYAVPYVQAAVQNKLMVGDANGQFHPHGYATRAETAEVLTNVLQLTAHK